LDTIGVYVTDANEQGHVMGHLVPPIPSSVAQAQQNPDSVAMRAADGCYMPFAIDTDAELQFPRFGFKVYHDRAETSYTGIARGTRPIIIGNDSPENVCNWDLPTGSTPCGAYFTGLSPQTSLDVVGRWVIEIFPGYADTQLSSLAGPSPAHDPLAIESYTAARRILPIAVPVVENGLGDWLRDVVDTVKDVVTNPAVVGVAKTIASATPMGRAALAAGEVVKQVKQAKKERKQKKKLIGLAQTK